MDNQIENMIIELYLNGMGSTTISKKLSINKHKILKLLRKKELIRDRKNTKESYEDFWESDGKWFTYWVCNECDKKIISSATQKYYLLRNLKNKNICKKCSLLKQHGENNPFFGRKHSDESIKKISNAKIGKLYSDHMSKPEYRELISQMTKKRWLSGAMEETRIKLSNLMKKRISNGELKGYNRSKAEDEILNIIRDMGLECEPNFLIESKIFDIYIPKFNLLIEYNGDYWHCNPKKYESNYFNHKKNKLAKEIWEYDRNKVYLALKYDYHCEVVWESDYKKNKDILYKIIKKYDNN